MRTMMVMGVERMAIRTMAHMAYAHRNRSLSIWYLLHGWGKVGEGWEFPGYTHRLKDILYSVSVKLVFT